ncbi:MAG: Gfo/Idh/MocA family protein [Candidatus Zhuqueibacterota bacterium]
METTKFRIGIVGVTGIAQIAHLPILKGMKNVEVVALCDSNVDHAHRIANKFNVPRVYSDIEEMLQFSEIDLVDVCTPVQFHVPNALAALENGKHVLIEKPFADNYSDAEEIVRAATRCDRNILSVQNLRYRPDAIILRNIIDHKLLGNIRYAKSGWLRRNERWRMPATEEFEEADVLKLLGLQLLDLDLWLLGNPGIRSVKATTFQLSPDEKEDSAFVQVQLENEVMLTAEIGWNMKCGKDFRFVNLVGDNGVARLNPLTIFRDQNGKLVDITPSQRIVQDKSFQRSYENELSHYVFCLSHHQKIESHRQEIIQRFRLLDAIKKSVSTRKEIEVE